MLDDVTAFVTGASQGIGREIAITLADHGATVALAARGDGIHDTADAIDAPDRTLAVETDVTDEESVEAAIQETVDTFGGLDCLVNNAGIAGPVQPYDRVEEADFEQVLDVNLIGAWRCVKQAGAHLRESDQGSVVNIGSIGGKRPYANRTPYSASKMGLVGLSRTLAAELGRDDVTVNVIQPGPVQGDRIDDAIQEQAKLADVENAEPASVGGDDFTLPEYFIDPEDVAEQVAYLAGPHARKITGQEIAIDAGGTCF
ncbi:SDR family NAD(P)-dependent oxidoreductase [Halorientalis regularis]|jgi:NAD(P)-dependent dehydrogenase (short-subunit alcohol dehydrogenase family)|uniref:NAD(P)-dependent dehydrogenase, short-chain alcohol dehydrogenase family n=1 Tax=Halorientalis regularis TaxID=660518 RepID=A0A1G7PGF2_9EURY|nr:SDR family oxidoreductase [Halorientalis regularis]SDF85356.1 NAD(P)-dependent dehydrogenase, short-chain alcohol dehydrogenase family [Halorientalis regularis]